MDITSSEFDIRFHKGQYTLRVDGEVLKTPANNDISHPNEALIEKIIWELECLDELDPAELSTYRVLSTQLDIVEDEGSAKIFSDNFRSWVLQDATLFRNPGPEGVHQFGRWKGLHDLLKTFNLKYPDFPQLYDQEELEEYIDEGGEEYSKNVDEYVSKLFSVFQSLSGPQKASVLNSVTVHGAVTYGILLASEKCSETQYAQAILAAESLFPGLFDNIDKTDYRNSFAGLIQDAFILSDFIGLSRYQK